MLRPEMDAAYRDVRWRKRRSNGSSVAAGAHHRCRVELNHGDRDAGIQGIGRVVVDVTLGDHFELIAVASVVAMALRQRWTRALEISSALLRR
jgi:hypothetical protein